MGNKAGKEGKRGKRGKAREDGDSEDSDDDGGSMAKAVAEKAWLEAKDGRAATRQSGVRAPGSREDWDGSASEQPNFLDGKGKLLDAKSKKWVDVRQSPKGEVGGGGGEFVSKVFPSGNRYEGKMVNGTYHGQGTLTYADGRKYSGGWHQGVMHGRGKFNFANGDIYDGDYFGGRQEGNGKFLWKSGDTYEGQWKAGKRHGKGKLSKVNGDGYNGMWKDGNPDMQMLKNVHR